MNPGIASACAAPSRPAARPASPAASTNEDRRVRVLFMGCSKVREGVGDERCGNYARTAPRNPAEATLSGRVAASVFTDRKRPIGEVEGQPEQDDRAANHDGRQKAHPPNRPPPPDPTKPNTPQPPPPAP